MIRHGERCDLSQLEEERARIEHKDDSPLTNLGVSQAHMTGKFLKDYLTKGGY